MSSHPWVWSDQYHRYYRFEDRNGIGVCIWDSPSGDNTEHPPAGLQQTWQPSFYVPSGLASPEQQPRTDTLSDKSPSPWHWSATHGRYYRRHVVNGKRTFSWDTTSYTFIDGHWKVLRERPALQNEEQRLDQDETDNESELDEYSDERRDELVYPQDLTVYMPPDKAHTDSGYASQSRVQSGNTSANADPTSASHDIAGTESALYDIQSIMSDNSDINSTLSYQTTWIEQEGKDYIAQMLAFDDVLHPLCQDALATMGRARFVRNVRRILKAYYRNLLQDARTERERLCVGLLRSRHGRQRMSQLMADIFHSDDNQEDELQERLIQHRKDTETINAWIKVLPNNGLVDAEPMDMSREALPFEGTDEGSLSDSSGESSDDNLIENSHLDEMTRFFCDSRSFHVLVNEFRTLLLPSRIRDILLSHPRDRIWISTEQDATLSNQIKSYIEDYTQLRWDWWPLQPRLRKLGSDQSRLFTQCSCGKLLWTEVSADVARIVEEKLQEMDPKGLRQSRCRTCRPSTHWFKNISKYISTVAPSRSSQRYIPSSGAPVSTTLVQGPQSSSNSQMTVPPQQQQQQHGSTTASRPQTTVSSQQISLPMHWILLGVKGPRPSLEISHISVHQHTNDSGFYQLLRQEYRRSRGKIRLWFSFWRLGYCEVVKFKRIAPQWIIRERKELPLQAEYVYQPRPPTADNPPISQHEFEMHLNACTKPCRWRSPFHYCMPELNTTTTIQRIPKKDKVHAFDIPSNDDKDIYAWGLEATHVISALHIFIYHILIFLVPFGFWGWWISRHPDDLQGAAVPATFVLGLLSLFWSMNGILTEGRHGSKNA